MLYKSFLIKYAEIGTKGKNRFMFEDALIKQIRHALKHVEGEFTVSKESAVSMQKHRENTTMKKPLRH